MKDKLLQYRGGGYDGCFWEWNACFWDKNGKWFDINASGRSGLKTEEDALNYIELKESHTYLIDLTSDLSIKDFVKNSALMFVCEVANTINAHYDQNIIGVHCNYCKELIYPHKEKDKVDFRWKFDETNYHGDGGIGIVYEGIICAEDLSGHTCSNCGEFVDEIKDLYVNGPGSDVDHCIYCATENELKEFNKDKPND